MDSINHYAKEIRSLESRILALKQKILEVCLLFTAYTFVKTFNQYSWYSWPALHLLGFRQ